MKTFNEYLIQFLLIIAILLLICLEALDLHKDYKVRNVYKCNIYHDVSVAERQCEYVDGIVKIKP